MCRKFRLRISHPDVLVHDAERLSARACRETRIAPSGARLFALEIGVRCQSSLAEAEKPDDDLPDWQKEEVKRARAVLNGEGRFEVIPHYPRVFVSQRVHARRLALEIPYLDRDEMAL